MRRRFIRMVTPMKNFNNLFSISEMVTSDYTWSWNQKPRILWSRNIDLCERKLDREGRFEPMHGNEVMLVFGCFQRKGRHDKQFQRFRGLVIVDDSLLRLKDTGGGRRIELVALVDGNDVGLRHYFGYSINF